jgi:hypothetical protein
MVRAEEHILALRVSSLLDSREEHAAVEEVEVDGF